ncbi:hypothetical protein PT282_07495 [Bifidobacterium sp. ESL0763]|uniref:hypothetical protein n=1 Tax=Bifidobacterium sp. ESL0763 TaxID=2983227 RepID=UPI0023F9CBE2|nr:hypothetical protein [Bifidobacterium sp. ESL0763]MDF7664498.1 hypothetical protein [Bifidobacterium sp. ESL0763]
MHYFTPKRCASSRKIIYHDKAQAERAARQGLIERGAELWVYRCEYCGGWHLTHHDPKEEHLLRGMGAQATRQGKPRSRKRGFKPRRR